MELIPFVTPEQEEEIEKVNLAFLRMARVAVQCDAGKTLGLEKDLKLCNAIFNLTEEQERNVASCGYPIVALRVNDRMLSSAIDASESNSSVPPATGSLGALIQEVNKQYLLLAHSLVGHQAGCMILGVQGNPALRARIAALTKSEIFYLSGINVPLIGIRVNARLLSMLAETDRNQNVDAFAFLQTLADKSSVTTPITHLEDI